MQQSLRLYIVLYFLFCNIFLSYTFTFSPVSPVFSFFNRSCTPGSYYISPKLRRTNSQKVMLSELQSVVMTMQLEDNVPSCPIFFAMI